MGAPPGATLAEEAEFIGLWCVYVAICVMIFHYIIIDIIIMLMSLIMRRFRLYQWIFKIYKGLKAFQ